MPSNTRSPNVRSAQLSALILFVTWVYEFWPAIKSIVTIYYQSSYDHYGFGSLLMVSWLFWMVRNRVANFDPSPNIYGFIAIIITSIIYIIACYNNWLFFQHLLLISLLPLIVFATSGIRVTAVLVFPISCMVLLIPVGYLIVPHVLNIMIKILNVYLKFIGFAWYLTDQEELNKIQKLFFAVNYLIANFIVIISFSYFKIENITNKILFVITETLLPIMINILIAIIMLSIQILGLQVIVGLYPVISIISWVVGLMIGKLIFSKNQLIIECQFAQLNFVAPTKPEVVFWDPNVSWFKLTVIAVMALIIPGWVVNNFLDNPWIEDYKLKFFLRAPNIEEWAGPNTISANQWQPKFFGISDQILASYMAKQKEVWLYSAYYYKILQSGGLIDANNKLYDDKFWTINQTAGVTVPLFKKKSSLLVNEILLINNDKKQLIWYWYYVGNIVSHDQDFMYMLNGVKTVASIRDDAGIIAVATNFEQSTNIEEVRSRLIYFINSLEPDLKNIMHPRKA